jgi:hypothetical protein
VDIPLRMLLFYPSNTQVHTETHTPHEDFPSSVPSLTTPHPQSRIFELQDRSLDSFITTFLLGLAVFVFCPYFAWKLRSPGLAIFTYVVPIVPFVLVLDGLVSGLRTRTADEVAALLRSCGAQGLDEYEVKSGRSTHLPPTGHLSWVICEKRSG